MRKVLITCASFCGINSPRRAAIFLERADIQQSDRAGGGGGP
jgi:hypothetical protein